MNFGFFGPKMAVSWRTSAFQKKGPETPIFRATSLGPKPSFFLFVFLVVFFCFLFFWRVKGQVRWPKGPPHLALNPPYLFLLLFCFVFCFFGCLIQKRPCFPLEKGIFCLFSVFLFLSPLALFGLPLFVFLFHCLSFFFFSFFLPSCLCFLLSFGSLFLSLSFFFFLLCFSFMKGTTSNNSIASFSSSIFSLFSVSCLFFFQVPFSFLCCFLIVSYVFCSTSRFLVSKQTTKKKNLVKRGVATKRFFFYQPLFCKMWKVIVFFGPFFWQFLGDIQKTL